MVHITSKTVEGFKKTFKRDYGVEYSDKEAWEATHNLLGAFEWLLEQDRKQNPENYKNQNSDAEGRVKLHISERGDNLGTSMNKLRARE